MYNFSDLTMETAQLGKKPNQTTKATPTPQKTPKPHTGICRSEGNKVLGLESSRSARAVIDTNNQALLKNQVHRELVKPFL